MPRLEEEEEEGRRGRQVGELSTGGTAENRKGHAKFELSEAIARTTKRVKATTTSVKLATTLTRVGVEVGDGDGHLWLWPGNKSICLTS